jgi:hypothetical protein
MQDLCVRCAPDQTSDLLCVVLRCVALHSFAMLAFLFALLVTHIHSAMCARLLLPISVLAVVPPWPIHGERCLQSMRQQYLRGAHQLRRCRSGQHGSGRQRGCAGVLAEGWWVRGEGGGGRERAQSGFQCSRLPVGWGSTADTQAQFVSTLRLFSSSMLTSCVRILDCCTCDPANQLSPSPDSTCVELL